MKNTNRVVNSIFVCIVMLTIVIPLLLLNRDDDAVTFNENRPLAGFPHFHSEDGFMGINVGVGSEIENYINDRIGLRDEFIALNAQIQYYVFGKMEDTDKYRLGPNGEFNIIEGDMVETYQHKNLVQAESLDRLTADFERFSDYLSQKGCDLYFVECWGKESIYPEYFPRSVNQYGDISSTDQIVSALEKSDKINVVSMKDEFLSLKDKYEIYSPYGDPVHWTYRGAYMGYTLIMDEINKSQKKKLKVLSEDDYDIAMTEQGMVFYGGVTRSNMSETFELKNRSAYQLDNPADYYSGYEDARALWYKNDSIANGKRLMIYGNSFIYNYILDDLAESFSEVMFVYTQSDDYYELIESYDPDIFIYEVAERYSNCDIIIAPLERCLDKIP